MNRKNKFVACALVLLLTLFCVGGAFTACADPVKPVQLSEPEWTGWQEAYQRFILNREYEAIGYPMYLPDGYEINPMTDGSVELEYRGFDMDPIWFSLHDLDNNQIPELIAFNGMGFMAGNVCHVYTFCNQAMVYVGTIGQRELLLCYSTDTRYPGLVSTDGNMDWYTTEYWYLNNDQTDRIVIETITYEEDDDYYIPREAKTPTIIPGTDDMNLMNWYHSAPMYPLVHWDYQEIMERGWDAFVSVCYFTGGRKAVNQFSDGPILPAAELHETVQFGHYPQDAAGCNMAPIEWYVIAKEDHKALLLSVYGIDLVQYHWINTGITWAECSLHEWLNSETGFLGTAFSREEAKRILDTKCQTRPIDIEGISTMGGADTCDKVFVLSLDEFWRYVGDYSDWRYVRPTDYALAKGARTDGWGQYLWWLRSPGTEQNVVCDGKTGGAVSDTYVDTCQLLRPAIWVMMQE